MFVKILPLYESQLAEFQGMTPHRNPMDDVPLQVKQKFGIMDSPPTKLYHGGSAGITKDNLAMVRNDDTLDIKEFSSGSAAVGNIGFYLTHHLYPNDGSEDTLNRSESADKYALNTLNRTGKPVCLYEVSLSPNTVLATKTGNLPFNVYSIKQDSETLKLLVKAGIDGFYQKSELVIWNKDKITNMRPIACAKEKKYSCAIGRDVNQNVSNAKGKAENEAIVKQYFKDKPYKTINKDSKIYFIGDEGHINCIEMNSLDYIKT